MHAPTPAHRRAPRRPTADLIDVDAHFRDSYVDEEGETVVHEYTLIARVDPPSSDRRGHRDPRCCRGSSVPRPPPAPDAWPVGRSARSVAGVRAEFLGATTCTHLNDMFRALADVGHLAARVGAAGG